jgi:alkylation response protein AidB-like acyl-CoA dehydrogenase
MRALSRVNARGIPGPEGSVLKLLWSEFSQRMEQIAMELLGPYGQLEGGPHAVDSGEWAFGYLRARASTIAAGTSEIQRNIIGHNVLGLPKSY